MKGGDEIKRESNHAQQLQQQRRKLIEGERESTLRLGLMMKEDQAQSLWNQCKEMSSIIFFGRRRNGRLVFIVSRLIGFGSWFAGSNRIILFWLFSVQILQIFEFQAD